VETSRVSTGEMVAAIGGAVLFVSLFLNWSDDLSAWESLDVTDIWLALIALVVVGLALARAAGSSLDLPAPAGTLMFALGSMAAVITLVLLFEGVDVKFGLWLAFLSTLGIIYGGLTAGRVPAPRQAPPPPPPPPEAPPPPATGP
jgi:hypothetical protein